MIQALTGLVLKEEYFLRNSDVGSYKNTKRIIDSVAFSWRYFPEPSHTGTERLL